MSVRDKWVRRFSVDETAKHKNGFTIYKITSVLFPLDSPEAVTVVSVWKRYSDAQRLHKSMRSLHAGLHLRGTFPAMPKSSFFKRFQQEVIEERSKAIKTLLEFVAEHRMLFASTDFVNFLQTGYPEPEPEVRTGSSVIAAIRSSLHLPLEDTPPLEYHTSDDERSPTRSARSVQETPSESNPLNPQTDVDISQIPIYEAADVEIRASPKTTPKLSIADSFESINSLPSIDFELYDEVSKIAIDKPKPSVKVLPDLISFDAPSTSKFDDYHTMKTLTETSSLNSTICDSIDDSRRTCDSIEGSRRTSSMSLYSKRSALSLSNVDSKTRTEDSYIFEAGYMLNLAARCENEGDYQRAFEFYKSGIEKMLIGVQSDTNTERRAVVKQKTNKYLSYAEAIYKNHLCDTQLDHTLLQDENPSHRLHIPIPLSMIRRSYEDLSLYRVLAVLDAAVMLVHNKGDQACYAMKVIQKIPNNLTEFDDYFQQRVSETRTPILPTVVPYMVTLHAFIETNNLYFLILSYAPGKKLFDYIKHYAKSIPTTPAREVNLDNVFSEPIKKIDIDNDNVDVGIDAVDSSANISEKYLDSVNENLTSEIDVSVNDLVINSQKLLLNVDRVLSETSVSEKRDGKTDSDTRKKEMEDSKPEMQYTRLLSNPLDVLPPSTICKWGAEILTALESLHNSGVVCRDLNPNNILLGDNGQVILTYFLYYPGIDMALAQIRNKSHIGNKSHISHMSPIGNCALEGLYVAPELITRVYEDGDGEGMEKVCDFWSFGAIMYELLCGVPLSYYHKVFTSHTLLRLPDNLPLDAGSLLTQLLTFDPSERLGAGAGGIADIKHHPYFRHVDWQAVYDSWIVPD